MDDDPTFCDGFVARANKTGKKIALCPYFFETGDPIRGSETIFHETAHLQKNDNGHVTCLTGDYKGDEGSCDNVFYNGKPQGGAYNHGFSYLATIAKTYSFQDENTFNQTLDYLEYMLLNNFNNVKNEEVIFWTREFLKK